jgi:O-antigen/teichoic acid export membrane protein
MMALDRLWAYVAVTAAGAVVILALNWLLVPPYAAVGAALANTLGQAAVAVPSVIFANRLVGGNVVWEGWALLRMAVASAVAGLVAWAPVALWGDAVGLAAGLVTGAVGLALAVRVLRVLPAGDARWLADISLGGRLPAVAARWIRPKDDF